jgi:tetratricopeptide (TPR) repeat protein/CHAT domain-containing protein
MPNNLRRLLFVILLCLPCTVCAQESSGNAATPATDEAALRALVAQYYDAYAKKDRAGFVAVWSQQSPQLNARRQSLDYFFSQDSISFTPPAISHLTIENDKARLRVHTRRTTSMGNDTTLTEVRSELSFVKEAGGWKLWSERPAITNLFNALAIAPTDDERQQLLAQDADLISRDLLFMLISNSDNAYRQADYARALNVLSSARLVAERLSDKKELAGVWHNLGIIHFMQNRPAQALETYQKSLALEEELGRPFETARSLASIGLAYSAQGQHPTAIQFFTRALAFYERLNHQTEIAQTLENIGNSYYEQGDYARAVEFYERGLPLLATNPNATAGKLLKIARIEYEQGHDTAAIDLYQRAADQFAAAGHKRTIGYAFHNIANILYAQGDYAQALRYYQQSLQAEEEAGTREGSMSALQGIGLIHALNNNHPLALAAYEKNLRLAEVIGDAVEIAAALQKVAGAHFNLGQRDQALALYQKVLTLREEIKDPQETAHALLDVGVTHAAKGDFAAAREAYQKSRALYETINNTGGVAAVLLNLSLLSYTQGDYNATLKLADEAAALTRQSPRDVDLFWQARYRAGKAHYRLAKFALARAAFTEAIAIVETQRPQLNRVQQPRFYESKLAPYLAMVDVAVNENHGYEALDFAERARARTLLGILQSAKIWINKTMSPREQEQERRLLSDLTTFTTQIHREQERTRPNPARIGELQTRLQQTQLDYTTFRNQLYRLRPQLKVLRGEGQPLPATQAATLVADAQTALLEFVETDEALYLFAFTKVPTTKARIRNAQSLSPLKIYELATNRADINTRVAQFLQAIGTRDEAIKLQARALYDLLLKPAQEQLMGKTHLIIMPDPVLWNLPFQALRTEANRYLIEDAAISYAPSLTALNAFTRLRPRAAMRRQPTPKLLVFAAPSLSQSTIERLKALPPTAPNNSPTETPPESQWLSKIPNAQIFTGADAREDRFKTEAGKYPLLHLAAPTVLQETSPLFSLTALATDEQTKDDGRLEAREILSLDLSAALAVLPDSYIAAPRLGVSRALTGWTWAWFVAGCPAMIINQWPVPASSNNELMLELHRQLQRASTPGTKTQAWPTAVRQLLKREEYRHPYFWAGWTVLGDTR